MMEGSGINKTLAQQFFADLAGQTARCDVPPEKSEQTMRIKLSSTPWVVPTTVDRRLGDGPETIIPKLQRLNQASAGAGPSPPTSPFAGVSPSRSPYGGPLSPLASTPSASTQRSTSSASAGLDMYVVLRPPSRDADRFDMPVHIVEDPSVLPIQPPAPVREEVVTRPSTSAPFTSSSSTPFAHHQPEHTRSIMATPGKQIFKSPDASFAHGGKSASHIHAPTPAPSSSASSFRSPPQHPGFLSPQQQLGFLSPQQQSGFLHPYQQQQPQPQPQQSILLSPTRLSSAFPQPPSTTRKRVTFSASVEDTPSRGPMNKPAPIQQSFLSPSAGPSDYRYGSPY